MNKPGVLLAFFLLTVYSLNGQIRREILSFVDSTELLVQQGRRMMLNELNNNNLEKAGQIYNHLSSATQHAPFAAFYFVEELYINLLTGNWPKVESLINTYNPNEKRRLYPNSPEVFSLLFKMVQERSSLILAGSKDAGINEEVWKMLDLIFYYHREDRQDEVFNKKLSDYKKNFRASAFPEFRKQFIPGRLFKGAINFSFGSGLASPGGDLASYFSGNASFNMGMDVNVDCLFTSLYLHGTNLKSRVPLIAITPRDTLFFENGDKFSYLDAGLRFGYFLLRSYRFHIAPYVSASGSFLESTLYEDPRDNKLEVRIFNTFTYGAGLHTELKLHEYSNRNIYGVTNKSYLSLKLDTGYSKMSKMKTLAKDGTMPYLMLAFVMGFGQF